MGKHLLQKLNVAAGKRPRHTHTQRHTGASGGFLHVDPSAQAWGEDGAAVPASLYWSSIAGCLVFVKGGGDFLFSGKF